MTVDILDVLCTADGSSVHWLKARVDVIERAHRVHDDSPYKNSGWSSECDCASLLESYGVQLRGPHHVEFWKISDKECAG